ncbi:MAG: hypothetical protein ABIO05_08860 [Ferruginibacter sp.]
MAQKGNIMELSKYTLFSVNEGNTDAAGGTVVGIEGLDFTPIKVGKGAPILTATNPLIDVAHDFPWTLSPKEARAEVPLIRLTEWRLNQSNIINAVKYWYNVGKSAAFAEADAINPYKSLYPGVLTGFNYLLPYFSPHNKNVGNTWECEDVAQSLPIPVDLVTAAAKLLATGVGHEVPRVYSGGSLENINIEFVLLNTTSTEDLQRNWEFCYLLAYQNLQNRRNAILVDPPVFYEVEIPGIKYGYSVMSNIEITHLGQTKLLELDRERARIDISSALGFMKIIPEAYKVSITLSDLIPQSRNFMEAMRSEAYRSKVTATEDAPITQIGQDIKDAVTRVAGEIGRGFAGKGFI